MSLTKKNNRIAFFNGPNLNLLGARNVEIYGKETLTAIETRLAAHAVKAGYTLRALQSNSEGGLIDAVHEARQDCVAVIINPGAYSHSSIALRDALECFAGPIIEVHLSNIFQREEFRRHSYISEVASGVICGLGPSGYDLALQAVVQLLSRF